MKNTAGLENPNATASPLNLLIVERNDDQWWLMRRTIQASLPEVTLYRVTTPQKALTQLRQWLHYPNQHPRLVLLDLYLPDREDGWLLIQAIKQLPDPLNSIPIALFGDSQDIQDLADAYQLGVFSYLVKPRTNQEWLTRVEVIRNLFYTLAFLPPPGTKG